MSSPEQSPVGQQTPESPHLPTYSPGDQEMFETLKENQDSPESDLKAPPIPYEEIQPTKQISWGIVEYKTYKKNKTKKEPTGPDGPRAEASTEEEKGQIPSQEIKDALKRAYSSSSIRTPLQGESRKSTGHLLPLQKYQQRSPQKQTGRDRSRT
ncbi:hypothetical protein CYMTET_48026 [Cymbomonas tetramitiformis]|uniref:Uncharacterized protein n=1 Tax=Cymbomonas tetramitiformis TaxID=36881 RepID=A0AAE0BUN0_9CHLO|nr:hypothetical protein CYMTET_48026 [Cymbomonas tetramitiformis]